MSCTNPDTEFEALVYLADRLRLLFPEVDEGTVFALIAEELESFDGARLRDYVPVLVEHNVLRRLRADPTGGVVSGGCGLQPSLRIPFHETVPLVNGGVRSSAASPYPGRMVVGREEFGPIRVVWADAAASALPSLRMPRILGEQQVRRYAALSGSRAQRFLAGTMAAGGTDRRAHRRRGPGLHHDVRALRRRSRPASAGACSGGGERQLRGQHGRRCGVATRRMPPEVGVDIEREPGGGAHAALDELAPLFAPAPAPDTAGVDADRSRTQGRRPGGLGRPCRGSGR